MKRKNPRLSIGLALSGGAARGGAHLGVLQALEDNNIYPAQISGTSIGALVAALYAFNTPIIRMLELAGNMKWLGVTSFTLSRLGLLSNEEICEIIEEELGVVNIEDAQIPLAIVASDIATGEKVVFRSGNLGQAVMASTCIPGIFKPVTVNNRMLVDGLIVENVPVSPLKEMGAGIIIAVDLGSEREYREPDGLIDVMLNAFSITLDRAVEDDLKKADVVIEPKVSKFKRSDLKRIPELYDEGYRAASVMVDIIRKQKYPLFFRLIQKFSPSRDKQKI